VSYQSVDIHVVSKAPSKDPVEGFLVRVFDEVNAVFYDQGTTDSEGKAGFTLFIGTYSLRFYKFGAHVDQPLLIEVKVPTVGDPLINAFTVGATTFEHPIANDARLCRASGYFRDVTGAPQPNLDIHLIGQFEPILLEGSAILGERRSLRTDKNGFACVDLIRCARYTATLQGMEDTQRVLEVPDLPSVNLPDLLFPVVAQVTLTPPGPYAMRVGDSLTIVPVVSTSSDVPLEGSAIADVMWSSSDYSVIGVGLTATEIVITAKAKGSAQLLAARRDGSVVHIPSVPIQGVPVDVTVT